MVGLVAGTLEIVKSEIGRLLGLDGHNDPAETNGEYAPFLTGDGLRGLRVYPINKAFMAGNDYKLTDPVFYNTLWDDFLGAAVNANTWNKNLGSDGSAAAAIVSPANNGIVRLTTGAGSTHTPAVNGSQLVGSRNVLISDSATRFEARLGNLSGAAGQNLCMGLTDSTTINAPFTIAAGVVTATGTNAVAFVKDASGTNTKLNACAVNAGGAVQVVALGNDVGGAAVLNRYRIEVNALGNANFYIDGALVASIAGAVAAAAVLAPTVGMFSEVTSGSQTVDVDYVLAQQLRV